MEAFIATGNDEDYFSGEGTKSLWYIGDNKNVECIIDEQGYWYFSDIPFVVDKYKLLYVGARHGYYALFGIYSDSPVEIEMPAIYYWIDQDPETGVITAAGKREERAHVLEYDPSSMSFMDTGKTVLSK